VSGTLVCLCHYESMC